MNAAVGLMDGLGLDGDRCIHVIPRQSRHPPGIRSLLRTVRILLECILVI